MAIPPIDRRLERIQRRVEELRAWRNAAETEITSWSFRGPDGETADLVPGSFWPVVTMPVTLSATADVPAGWAGLPVELELWVGGEGLVRLSTGYQAGLNPMHHRFPVFEQAAGGERVGIEVEAVPKGIFGSHLPEPRIERAHLVVPQREVRAFERDLSMLVEACLVLHGEEVEPFLLGAAERALDELQHGWPTDAPTAIGRYVRGYHNGIGSGTEAVPPKWRPEAIDAARPTSPTWSLPEGTVPLAPLADDGIAAVGRARELLAAELDRVRASYPPVGALALTGHAHIDLGWLWPVHETRRKTRRTFSTVLDLMERYPDFTFNQSSAQAYAWIAEDDPALFERIQARVAEGRWDPVGGMWLESDCNLIGGESMARQLLYGQRWFGEQFGRRHRVAWLPDVFGFSGGMPQLLRSAGIEGFFTIKVNWNEATKFPYDLFRWEGIDGTSVIAHTFENPGEGYNGNIVPLDTLGTWRHFRGKTLHGESLLAFGWGDGAGGPSEKMLENYARLRDFPALPRLRMTRVDEFFATLPAEGLPTYTGELYFELHRGTLTTQGETKALNRAGEHRLLEADAWGAIAATAGATWPQAEAEAAWKTLLLNQFHDILPGSSIREVYEVTIPELEGVVATASRLRDAAIDSRLSGTEGWTAASAALNPRPLLVEVPGAISGAVAADGAPLAVQPVEGGTLVAGAMVPGLGLVSFRAAEVASVPDLPVSVTREDSCWLLENDLVRVQVGIDGTIHSMHDHRADREVLLDRANQVWAYVDKPRAWDAWDVDETHERAGEEITSVESIEVVEAGPIRGAIRVRRRWRGSTITQTYRLEAGSTRVDIVTEIDWQERQVLLKARFPVAVRGDRATFETMFGVVHRPTHRNTAADAAQFEGSAHRFCDLSEPGYGVALLNDGKYGHGVHGSVVTVSLVRGPLYPDPLADLGHHRFTISIFPHRGDWTDAGVVDEAFRLNSPLVVRPGQAETVDGWVIASGLPLGLGALKPAEDGDGSILRLYEPHGARGRATLAFRDRVQSVERVNILEEPEMADSQPRLDRESGSVSIELRPFEVVTVRVR